MPQVTGTAFMTHQCLQGCTQVCSEYRIEKDILNETTDLCHWGLANKAGRICKVCNNPSSGKMPGHVDDYDPHMTMNDLMIQRYIFHTDWDVHAIHNGMPYFVL